MKLERNEIDSVKETGESRNHNTLFGNGLAKKLLQDRDEHRKINARNIAGLD